MAGKKIQPRNVDGHLQALRLQLIAKDLDSPQPKRVWRKKESVAGGVTTNQSGEAECVALQCNTMECGNPKTLETETDKKGEIARALTFAPDTVLVEKPDYHKWTKPLKP